MWIPFTFWNLKDVHHVWQARLPHRDDKQVFDQLKDIKYEDREVMTY
jgi:hypothetical protein